MTSSRALYDRLLKYLIDKDALSEVETLNEFYRMYNKLEEERITLQDELAMLHTIATDSYERRRASKYERD